MLQKSTEHNGVGQSGFTAGRNESDPLLDSEVQVRAEVGPDEPFDEDDDRFYGRGGILMPHGDVAEGTPGPDGEELDDDHAAALQLDRPGKTAPAVPD
jgi:hypothetical protein